MGLYLDVLDVLDVHAEQSPQMGTDYGSSLICGRSWDLMPCDILTSQRGQGIYLALVLGRIL